MNIKHESSFFGIVLNYIFSVIFLYYFWLLYNIGFKNGFSLFQTIVLLLAWCITFISFIYIIRYCVKTKYIIATDKNILIKNIDGDKILEYNDIIEITESSIEGITLCLKYRDNLTGKKYLIFTVPRNNFRFITPKNKSDMFNYIQERINQINKTVI